MKLSCPKSKKVLQRPMKAKIKVNSIYELGAKFLNNIAFTTNGLVLSITYPAVR